MEIIFIGNPFGIGESDVNSSCTSKTCVSHLCDVHDCTKTFECEDDLCGEHSESCEDYTGPEPYPDDCKENK